MGRPDFRKKFSEMGLIGSVCFSIEKAYWMLRSYILRKEFGLGAELYLYAPDKLSGLKYATIGTGFRSERGLWLECIKHYSDITYSPYLKIGRNCCLSRFCHVACAGNLEIGDDVLIGSHVLITDHGHGDYSSQMRQKTLALSPVSRPLKVKSVKIGSNVWIGDGAMILPGADIGNSAVIGAGAIVSGPIAPGKIIFGQRTLVSI